MPSSSSPTSASAGSLFPTPAQRLGAFLQRAGRGLEGRVRGRRWGRAAVIGVPFGFLLLFFSAPFLVVLQTALSDTDGLRVFGLADWTEQVLHLNLHLGNFLFLASDALYVHTFWSSIGYAGLCTLVCLFIGYPFAYFMTLARPALRPMLVMLVSLPFWTSYLLRIYAWKGILDDNGVLNQLLLWLQVVGEPLRMMHTPFSLTVGMVYTYLPFMILPLYGTLAKADPRLIEAACDLGASPWRAFWIITVPLSRAGIIAGSMLVFIPCVGEYVIPELLGGPDTLMIGHVLMDEYSSNNDWPMASALAVVMVGLILLPLMLFHRNRDAAGIEARGGGR
jgi:putrescine transport system permease protein